MILLDYWEDKLGFIDFAGFKSLNAKPVKLDSINIRLKAQHGPFVIDEGNLRQSELELNPEKDRREDGDRIAEFEEIFKAEFPLTGKSKR